MYFYVLLTEGKQLTWSKSTEGGWKEGKTKRIGIPRLGPRKRDHILRFNTLMTPSRNAFLNDCLLCNPSFFFSNLDLQGIFH